MQNPGKNISREYQLKYRKKRNLNKLERKRRKKMKKRIILVLTLMVIFTFSLQPAAEEKDKPPRLKGVRLFNAILAGVGGNIVCGYAGGVLGYNIDKGDGDDGLLDGFGGALLGFSGGSTFGSALGVYWAGNSRNVRGSFGKALLGSVVGEALAVGITVLVPNATVALVSFITFPPICAVLFYNSSRRYRSLPGSNALLNFKRGKLRMGIPDVRIQSLPCYAEKVKPMIRVNVSLLSIAL
jgi:hypothetical protein